MKFEIETYEEIISQNYILPNDDSNIVTLSVVNKGTTIATYKNYVIIKPQSDPTDNKGLVLINSQNPVRNKNLEFRFDDEKDAGNKILISYSRIYKKQCNQYK